MQEELRELIAQKDALEKTVAQLSQQIALLEETKSLNGNLVDAEGFPRQDLNFGELAEYRTLKRRRNEANNDHLALMKRIEQQMFSLHASQPGPAGNSETSEPKHTQARINGTYSPSQRQHESCQRQSPSAEKKIDYLTPFARVSLVEGQSPAEAGGMQAGDLLSEFGEVMIYSLDWKKQLAGSVREGQPVRVVVMRPQEQGQPSDRPVFRLKDGRDYAKLELSITPRAWVGRGLLGCNIDPL